MFELTEITEHLAAHSVTWIFAIFTGVIGVLYKKITMVVKEATKQNKAMCEGVQAMLRSDVIDNYNHYKDKGYCPIYAKTNIKNLHKPYKELGGNGVVDKLVDELLEMPTQPSAEGVEKV